MTNTVETSKKIQEILFNIISGNVHTWIRYWKKDKTEGMNFKGEYVEIRSSFITEKCINELLEYGFKIDRITTIKINQDAYSDILFKKD